MEIGSLVILKSDWGFKSKQRADELHGWINEYPMKGKLYTVRNTHSYVMKNGQYCTDIWLEEIVNTKYQYNDGFNERAWAMGRFKEIISSENAISEINELLKEFIKYE